MGYLINQENFVRKQSHICQIEYNSLSLLHCALRWRKSEQANNKVV